MTNPSWGNANQADHWEIETWDVRNWFDRLLKRPRFQAVARGYQDGKPVADFGLLFKRYYGNTPDEAERNIRAAICIQKKAHTEWQAGRDIRMFAGDDICP